MVTGAQVSAAGMVLEVTRPGVEAARRRGVEASDGRRSASWTRGAHEIPAGLVAMLAGREVKDEVVLVVR